MDRRASFEKVLLRSIELREEGTPGVENKGGGGLGNPEEEFDTTGGGRDGMREEAFDPESGRGICVIFKEVFDLTGGGGGGLGNLEEVFDLPGGGLGNLEVVVDLTGGGGGDR